MVDFNTDNIVSQSPKQIIHIIILQRSENLAEAWEEYNKKSDTGIDTNNLLAVVRARLLSLYSRIRPSIERSLKKKPEDLALFKKVLNSDTEADLKEASNMIEDFLDTVGLTRIDIKKRYNPMYVEEENEAYGL